VLFVGKGDLSRLTSFKDFPINNEGFSRGLDEAKGEVLLEVAAVLKVSCF